MHRLLVVQGPEEDKTSVRWLGSMLHDISEAGPRIFEDADKTAATSPILNLSDAKKLVETLVTQLSEKYRRRRLGSEDIIPNSPDDMDKCLVMVIVMRHMVSTEDFPKMLRQVDDCMDAVLKMEDLDSKRKAAITRALPKTDAATSAFKDGSGATEKGSVWEQLKDNYRSLPLGWTPHGNCVYVYKGSAINVTTVHGACPFKTQEGNMSRNTGIDQIYPSMLPFGNTKVDPFIMRNVHPPDGNDPGFRPIGSDNPSTMHYWKDVATEVTICISVLKAAAFDFESNAESNIGDSLNNVEGRAGLSADFIAYLVSECDKKVRQLSIIQRYHMWHLGSTRTDSSAINGGGDGKRFLYCGIGEDDYKIEPNIIRVPQDDGTLKVPEDVSLFKAEYLKAHGSEADKHEIKKYNSHKKWEWDIAATTGVPLQKWLDGYSNWRASTRASRVYHYNRLLPKKNSDDLTKPRRRAFMEEQTFKYKPSTTKSIDTYIGATWGASSAYAIIGTDDSSLRFLVVERFEAVEKASETIRNPASLNCRRERLPGDLGYVQIWARGNKKEKYDPTVHIAGTGTGEIQDWMCAHEFNPEKKVKVFQEFGWPDVEHATVSTEKYNKELPPGNIRGALIDYIQKLEQLVLLFTDVDDPKRSPMAYLFNTLETEGSNTFYSPPLVNREDRPADPPNWKSKMFEPLTQEAPSCHLLKIQQPPPIGFERPNERHEPKQAWRDWENNNYFNSGKDDVLSNTGHLVLSKRKQPGDTTEKAFNGVDTLPIWDKFSEEQRVNLYQDWVAMHYYLKVRIFYYNADGEVVNEIVLPQEVKVKGKKYEGKLELVVAEALCEELLEETNKLMIIIQHERGVNVYKSFFDDKEPAKYKEFWTPLSYVVTSLASKQYVPHREAGSSLSKLAEAQLAIVGHKIKNPKDPTRTTVWSYIDNQQQDLANQADMTLNEYKSAGLLLDMQQRVEVDNQLRKVVAATVDGEISWLKSNREGRMYLNFQAELKKQMKLLKQQEVQKELSPAELALYIEISRIYDDLDLHLTSDGSAFMWLGVMELDIENGELKIPKGPFPKVRNRITQPMLEDEATNSGTANHEVRQQFERYDTLLQLAQKGDKWTVHNLGARKRSDASRHKKQQRHVVITANYKKRNVQAVLKAAPGNDQSAEHNARDVISQMVYDCNENGNQFREKFIQMTVAKRRNDFLYDKSLIFSSVINEHLNQLAGRINRLLGVSSFSFGQFVPSPSSMFPRPAANTATNVHNADKPMTMTLRIAGLIITRFFMKNCEGAMTTLPGITSGDRPAYIEERRRNGLALSVKARFDLRKVYAMQDGQIIYQELTQLVLNLESRLRAEWKWSKDIRNDDFEGQSEAVIDIMKELEKEGVGVAPMNVEGNEELPTPDIPDISVARLEVDFVQFAFARITTRENMLRDLWSDLVNMIQSGSLHYSAVTAKVEAIKGGFEYMGYNLTSELMGEGMLQMFEVVQDDFQEAVFQRQQATQSVISAEQTISQFLKWTRNMCKIMQLDLDIPPVFELQEQRYVLNTINFNHVVNFIVKDVMKKDFLTNVGSSEISDADLVYQINQQFDSGNNELITIPNLRKAANTFRAIFISPPIRGIHHEVYPFIKDHLEECFKNPQTKRIDSWTKATQGQQSYNAWVEEKEREMTPKVFIKGSPDIDFLLNVRLDTPARRKAVREYINALRDVSVDANLKMTLDKYERMVNEYEGISKHAYSRVDTRPHELYPYDSQIGTYTRPELVTWMAYDMPRQGGGATGVDENPVIDMNYFIETLRRKLSLQGYMDLRKSYTETIKELEDVLEALDEEDKLLLRETNMKLDDLLTHCPKDIDTQLNDANLFHKWNMDTLGKIWCRAMIVAVNDSAIEASQGGGNVYFAPKTKFSDIVTMENWSRSSLSNGGSQLFSNTPNMHDLPFSPRRLESARHYMQNEGAYRAERPEPFGTMEKILSMAKLKETDESYALDALLLGPGGSDDIEAAVQALRHPDENYIIWNWPHLMEVALGENPTKKEKAKWLQENNIVENLIDVTWPSPDDANMRLWNKKGVKKMRRSGAPQKTNAAKDESGREAWEKLPDQLKTIIRNYDMDYEDGRAYQYKWRKYTRNDNEPRYSGMWHGLETTHYLQTSEFVEDGMVRHIDDCKKDPELMKFALPKEIRSYAGKRIIWHQETASWSGLPLTVYEKDDSGRVVLTAHAAMLRRMMDYDKKNGAAFHEQNSEAMKKRQTDGTLVHIYIPRVDVGFWCGVHQEEHGPKVYGTGNITNIRNKDGHYVPFMATPLERLRDRYFKQALDFAGQKGTGTVDQMIQACAATIHIFIKALPRLQELGKEDGDYEIRNLIGEKETAFLDEVGVPKRFTVNGDSVVLHAALVMKQLLIWGKYCMRNQNTTSLEHLFIHHGLLYLRLTGSEELGPKLNDTLARFERIYRPTDDYKGAYMHWFTPGEINDPPKYYDIFRPLSPEGAGVTVGGQDDGLDINLYQKLANSNGSAMLASYIENNNKMPDHERTQLEAWLDPTSSLKPKERYVVAVIIEETMNEKDESANRKYPLPDTDDGYTTNDFPPKLLWELLRYVALDDDYRPKNTLRTRKWHPTNSYHPPESWEQREMNTWLQGKEYYMRFDDDAAMESEDEDEDAGERNRLVSDDDADNDDNQGEDEYGGF